MKEKKDENLDKSIFFYGFTYHLFDTMSRDAERQKKGYEIWK